MGKGNGRVFTVVVGSKQFFKCPLLDTSGPAPMNHLVAEVYSEGNDDCLKCGVCADFLLKLKLKIKVSAQDIVPVVTLREMVRPHGCDATREKIILRVSSGIR